MPRLKTKEMLDSLRRAKIRVYKNAIERAAKDLNAGVLYNTEGHKRNFPPPKTPADAKKYADIRADRMAFIERAFKSEEIPGMPKDNSQVSIESLAQLSEPELRKYLDKAIKAKKIDHEGAEKIRKLVDAHKKAARNAARDDDADVPL